MKEFELQHEASEVVARLADLDALVRSSSELALNWFRHSMRVENKAATKRSSSAGGVETTGGAADFDPVTEADRAVEAAIRKSLAEMFPNHTIIGEEFGRTDGTTEHTWVIDPIDGTRAFVTGQPMWGTLLGYCYRGTPSIGWMHVPVLGHSYFGNLLGRRSASLTVEPGAAPKPIEVAGKTDLSEAVLLCTHPEMFKGAHEVGFERLAESVKMVRFGGDCVNYGLLASGFAHLVVENGLAPHDIMPLTPIVEAAGGVVSGLDGSPVTQGFVVASANQELHSAALAKLT